MHRQDPPQIAHVRIVERILKATFPIVDICQYSDQPCKPSFSHQGVHVSWSFCFYASVNREQKPTHFTEWSLHIPSSYLSAGPALVNIPHLLMCLEYAHVNNYLHSCLRNEDNCHFFENLFKFTIHNPIFTERVDFGRSYNGNDIPLFTSDLPHSHVYLMCWLSGQGCGSVSVSLSEDLSICIYPHIIKTHFHCSFHSVPRSVKEDGSTSLTRSLP